MEFIEITNLDEAVNCWNIARDSLMSEHYGMTESQFLPHEYRRLVSHKYFSTILNGKNIGILRVIPDIPMHNYLGNLVPELIIQLKQGKTFCDLGYYYTEKVDSKTRRETIAAVVKFSKEFASQNGFGGLYIQIPNEHVGFYEKLGFSKAGETFTAQGWNKVYLPMYLLL